MKIAISHFGRMKLFGLILSLLAAFCCRAQQQEWSESQWHQYAYLNEAALNENRTALELIFTSRSKYFVDSISRLDIFTPISFNGRLVREGMEGPVIHGVQRFFHLNGEIAAGITYKNNQLDGDVIFYCPDGKIYSTSAYCVGKRCKTRRKYNTDNKLISSTTYVDDEKICDSSFYTNGTLMSVFRYHKGEIVKKEEKELYNIETHQAQKASVSLINTYETIYFDEQGKEISKLDFEKMSASPEFKSKKNHVDYLYAHSEERPDSKDQIMDDYLRNRVKTEQFKFLSNIPLPFDSLCQNKCQLKRRKFNSSLRFESFFPNARLNDTLKCKESGNIIRSSETNHGRLHGALRYFYSNGEKLAVFPFEHDFLHGTFYIYFQDGKTYMRGKFEHGQAKDSVLTYDRQGNLESLEVYSDTFRYVKTYYWPGGKLIQRKEVKTDEKYVMESQFMLFVRPVEEIKYYYFDREGYEISKARFEQDYPGILPVRVGKIGSVKF